MKVSEAYESAIEILDKRGWCRWAFESVDGRVCAEGALIHATTVDVGLSAYSAAINWHMKLFGEPLNAYNDLSQSVAEVRDRMMACAKAARDRGE